MLALALGVTTVPAVQAAVSTINNSSVSANKVSENIATDNSGEPVYKVTNLNNSDGRTTITIEGEGLGENLTVSGGTFTTDGKTYQATSMRCYLTDGQGLIVAIFPFIDTFDQSSLTLTINGKEMSFNIENSFAIAPVKPEVLPQYPGGLDAIMQAIMANVTFPNPEREWKEGASGLALVQFTVMPDGTMSNFDCAMSSGYDDLDQIAIDAVRKGLTEKWTPGTVAGQPVPVSYRLPIRFKPTAK